MVLAYAEDTKTLWGRPASAARCGKEWSDYQAVQLPAECLCIVRCMGVSTRTLVTLGGFLFAENTKTLWSCFMAQLNDLADMLNEAVAKISFLQDAFTQDQVRIFRFSEPGLFGLYLILRDIETMISHVANEMPQAKEA